MHYWYGTFFVNREQKPWLLHYKSKNIEWVCTKQYDRLFAGARSHGQQMGEGLYEREVQQMVHHTVKNWIKKWKGTRKYHDHVSFINNEPLSRWLIDCYDQLTLSHGKEIILAGWRGSGISAAVENGLVSLLIDPFN